MTVPRAGRPRVNSQRVERHAVGGGESNRPEDGAVASRDGPAACVGVPAVRRPAALQREFAQRDARRDRREQVGDQGAEQPATHRIDHMPERRAMVRARSPCARAYAGVRRMEPRPATRRSIPSATVSGASAP